jgi:uncharacterized protein (TIGR03437 family)
MKLMDRKQRLSTAKTLVFLGTIPVLLYAYEYGPPAGYTGAPGDVGTCSVCHSGGPGTGSVTIMFPNGLNYVPGVSQQLVVTIADPATTQGAWGFQLTARSAANAQAGAFTSVDANTQLVCSSNPLIDPGVDVLFGAAGGQICSTTQPLEYMEHTLIGFENTLTSKTGKQSGTYQVNWTPPSSNVGNIAFYLAGNAGSPALPLEPTGAHIYTNTYTLTPAASSNGPAITAVSNAASGVPGLVAGSFISIYGSNFTSVALDTWTASINATGMIPTQLDGVSVSIGGQPAFINAIAHPGGSAADQINVQAPDIPLGTAPVVVTTASGASSTPFTVNVQSVSPAFFPWPNNQPVATRNCTDGLSDCWAVASGTFPGQTTTPTMPGEIITFWGTGFGATNPPVVAGQFPGSNAGAPTQSPVTVTLNGNPISQVFGGFISSYAGEYEIIVQIPTGLPSGNYPLVATINGVSTPTYTLTIQQPQ